MALNTGRMGLTYSQPSDSNNVPGDIQRIAQQLDVLCVSFVRDVAANRPTSTAPTGTPGAGNYNPGTQGRWFYATDTGALSYDFGGGWYLITSALALITGKGDLIVGSAASTGARLGVGGDGQALVSRSGATLGMDWETQLGYPLGLPGAGTATRYVGATSTNGPPTSGTFNAGDWVACPSGGRMWVCQTGGTSGTWIEVGSQSPCFCATVYGQAVPSGGYTSVNTFQVLGVDTHSGVTSTGYVIPKAGVWAFDFQLMFSRSGTGTGHRFGRFTRNGDPAWQNSMAPTMNCVPGDASTIPVGPAKSMVAPYYLNVGDVVGVDASQDSGASMGIYGAGSGYVGGSDLGSTFSGRWLHA